MFFPPWYIYGRPVRLLFGLVPEMTSDVIPLPGALCFALQWSQFVKVADPDILTGYNIQNFDVPYLLNRAKTLSRTSKKLEKFAEWGRLRGKMATMK